MHRIKLSINRKGVRFSAILAVSIAKEKREREGRKGRREERKRRERRRDIEEEKKKRNKKGEEEHLAEREKFLAALAISNHLFL
jgi:hypothetical protein